MARACLGGARSSRLSRRRRPSSSTPPTRCAATSAAIRELYIYTRYANPTLQPLEQTLAALEEAEDALALASGMAAMTTAVLSIVQVGDEVVGAASLYGGTTHLLRQMLPRLGIRTRIVPDEALSDLSGDRRTRDPRG